MGTTIAQEVSTRRTAIGVIHRELGDPDIRRAELDDGHGTGALHCGFEWPSGRDSLVEDRGSADCGGDWDLADDSPGTCLIADVFRVVINEI